MFLFFFLCCLQLERAQIPVLKDWSNLSLIFVPVCCPRMHPGNGSLGVFRVRD